VIRHECSVCDFGINAYEGRFGPKPRCPVCSAAMLVVEPGSRVTRGVPGRQTASESVESQTPDFYLRFLIGLGALQIPVTLWWITAEPDRPDGWPIRPLLIAAAYPIQASIVAAFTWWKGRSPLAWGAAGGFFFLPCLLALAHMPALCRQCGSPRSRGEQKVKECPACSRAGRW
jgi:hypothetical protein